MPGEEKQWYSNKDLFERMEGLSDKLQETQKVVAKYNGLHEKLGNLEIKMVQLDDKVDKQISRCDVVQSKMEGKNDAYSLLLKLWPILISTIIFILSFTGKF